MTLFENIQELDDAYNFLNKFGSDFPSKFYLGSQSMMSNVIDACRFSIPLDKLAKCLQENLINDLKEQSFESSRPKATEMNTISCPSYDDRRGLDLTWVPIWKVVKALYVKRKLEESDMLMPNSSLMLLIHAYRGITVRNLVKEQTKRQREKRNEVSYQ
jgi:hypothetical protein